MTPALPPPVSFDLHRLKRAAKEAREPEWIELADSLQRLWDSLDDEAETEPDAEVSP